MEPVNQLESAQLKVDEIYEKQFRSLSCGLQTRVVQRVWTHNNMLLGRVFMSLDVKPGVYLYVDQTIFWSMQWTWTWVKLKFKHRSHFQYTFFNHSPLTMRKGTLLYYIILINVSHPIPIKIYDPLMPVRHSKTIKITTKKLRGWSKVEQCLEHNSGQNGRDDVNAHTNEHAPRATRKNRSRSGWVTLHPKCCHLHLLLADWLAGGLQNNFFKKKYPLSF